MKYIPYYISGAFCLVGLAAAVYGLFVIRKARESAGWPVAEGQVVHSQVDRNEEGAYAPDVRYSYVIEGVQFTGRCIQAGVYVSSSDDSDASRCVSRYPKGARVDVAYNPANPAEAVLEPGLRKRSFLFLAFGLGFSMFGAWFCLLFWLFKD
jgi:hypothetical protein